MSKTMLNVHEKILICEYKSKNPSVSQQYIAYHFSRLLDKKISRRAVGDILSDKAKWLGMEKALHSARRIKSGKHEVLEDALVMWITQVNEKHGTVTDELIKEQAKIFGEKFNIHNFSYSNGWLQRFKKRHDLSLRVRHGEIAEVDSSSVNSGRKKIAEVIAQYALKDVYNMDESGLFFSMMPGKTISNKAERGSKKKKSRITVVHCTNADGSDKRILEVIGKAKRPRCFKDFRPELYVNYKHNKKAWMTQNVFNEWLCEFNMEMKCQKRNILLILDNAPCHKSKGMSNIRIEFLPPNITGILQPMDAGIIKSFKAHYRRFLVKNVVEDINQKRKINVTLKDAIYFVKKAWDCVSQETIRNCWKHTGLINGDGDTADIIQNGALQELKSTLEQASPQLDIQISAEQFADIDCEEPVFEQMTADDIVEFLKSSSEVEDSGSDEDETTAEPRITNKEAQDCIKKLRCFFEQNDETDRDTINKVISLDNWIDKLCAAKKKQITLDSFVIKTH